MTFDRWTDEDIAILCEMIDDCASAAQIAEKLGRTENAIRLRASRMGLVIKGPSAPWTDEEEKQLADEWHNEKYSKFTLVKRHQRTWRAIREKARLLDLGSRCFGSQYMSTSEVCSALNIKPGKFYNWVQVLGLKTHKSDSKNVKFLVDPDELLEFLEKHQNLFSAASLDRYVFINEPTWLVEKRKADRLKNQNRSINKEAWSDAEMERLQRLYCSGYSVEELMKEFRRSKGSILLRLRIAGCKPKSDLHYSDKEIEIIRTYAGTHTVHEIAAMLPKRSVRSVLSKCKELDIPCFVSETAKNNNDTRRKTQYSDEESRILVENAGKKTIRELVVMLPGRSYASIVSKSYNMGLPVKYDNPSVSRYTDEEMQFIRDNITTMTVREMAEHLPGRTECSIYHKCALMKLKKKG